MNGLSMNSSVTESTHLPIMKPEEMSFRLVYLVLVSFAAASGNLLVLVAVFKFQSLRRAANLMLSSLALADFFVGTVTVPLYIVWTLEPGIFDRSHFMCSLVLLSCLLVVVASQISLLTLSIGQYLAVCLPFKHRELLVSCPEIHRYAVITTWVTSAVVTFGAYFTIRTDTNSCSYYGSFDKVFMFTASILGIFLPFVVIIVLNVKVLCTVRDYGKRWQDLPGGGRLSLPSINDSHDWMGRRWKRAEFARRVGLAGTIFDDEEGEDDVFKEEDPVTTVTEFSRCSFNMREVKEEDGGGREEEEERERDEKMEEESDEKAEKEKKGEREKFEDEGDEKGEKREENELTSECWAREENDGDGRKEEGGEKEDNETENVAKVDKLVPSVNNVDVTDAASEVVSNIIPRYGHKDVSSSSVYKNTHTFDTMTSSLNNGYTAESVTTYPKYGLLDMPKASYPKYGQHNGEMASLLKNEYAQSSNVALVRRDKYTLSTSDRHTDVHKSCNNIMVGLDRNGLNNAKTGLSRTLSSRHYRKFWENQNNVCTQTRKQWHSVFERASRSSKVASYNEQCTDQSAHVIAGKMAASAIGDDLNFSIAKVRGLTRSWSLRGFSRTDSCQKELPSNQQPEVYRSLKKEKSGYRRVGVSEGDAEEVACELREKKQAIKRSFSFSEARRSCCLDTTKTGWDKFEIPTRFYGTVSDQEFPRSEYDTSKNVQVHNTTHYSFSNSIDIENDSGIDILDNLQTQVGTCVGFESTKADDLLLGQNQERLCLLDQSSRSFNPVNPDLAKTGSRGIPRGSSAPVALDQTTDHVPDPVIDRRRLSTVSLPRSKKHSWMVRFSDSRSSSLGESNWSQAERTLKRGTVDFGRRVVGMVTLACLTFILAWFPFFVVTVIYTFCPHCYLIYCQNAVVMVAFTKSVFNPVIYALGHSSFRLAYRRLFYSLIFSTGVAETIQRGDRHGSL